MKPLTALLCALVASAASAARAADTTETWEPGAADVEVHVGVEALGLDREARTPWSDFVVGFGVVERLSLWLAVSATADAGFDTVHATPALGLFSTPLESDHVDLDLGIDLQVGDEEDHLRATPMVELNLDLDPERSSAGLYARAGVALHGVELRDPHGTPHERSTGVALEWSPGLYVAAAPGHELLAECDFGYHAESAHDGHRFEVGGVALGYNATLVDAVELVSELSADVPQADERWAFGVGVGFIATLAPAEAPAQARRAPP
ncbi:MAG: hypothetical protein HY908_27945 [Myxococcales bacterium]|nr:hypothetical protein [Myxococcales bacterium]